MKITEKIIAISLGVVGGVALAEILKEEDINRRILNLEIMCYLTCVVVCCIFLVVVFK